MPDRGGQDGFLVPGVIANQSLGPVAAMILDPPKYDPNEVMEALTSEDCLDIVWAVLEGGDPLSMALEIAKERR